MHAPVNIERRAGGLIAATFAAMASPCEVLLETEDAALARRLGELAAGEARRIERKFSRYRDDSVVARIHASGGAPVCVDEEAAALLDYAQQCHALSAGRFDITSGVLRRLWKFDGRDPLPSAAALAAVLPLVGFQRLTWRRPELTLPVGMEIDFGGLGKEYAVDRAFALLREQISSALLVNFGGDLRASVAPAAGPWRVGVDGVRYGHILDPRTGYPVEQAPLSVTVAAATCSEAGTFSTFAMLHGAGAEHLLEAEGLKYWCLR